MCLDFIKNTDIVFFVLRQELSDRQKPYRIVFGSERNCMQMLHFREKTCPQNKCKTSTKKQAKIVNSRAQDRNAVLVLCSIPISTSNQLSPTC